MSGAAFELKNINVHYGYARALEQVSLVVRPGEVVALLGDNGAGKSTLLKVMSGAHVPTAGELFVSGERVHFKSPRDASASGVQMVYQDLALVEAMDIAGNLMLGRERLMHGPLGWLGFLDRKAMRRESQRELDALGVRTAPVTRSVEMLSGGQRQVIAIARSSARLPEHGVLLMDEPTAALGHEQTELVESLIRTLAARGVSIVVVTHNLPLASAVSDRIVVLNRGRKVADVPTGETDKDTVVGWITGASVQAGVLQH
ncbi:MULTISPECIES: ATP-binding cassette domain-containing protein [Arthrobacter]|uniref:ATP-binding cassette domain-containing protein n=1 Tax=Arthrobacter caoxuetaonis TaxID=2886935 RepID=A0A9X1MDF0_9MICC|nr:MULTISPECIES: ATP-binding cassette domain-containing protein [Arthrobacter]MCC3280813.1 ATP-binding cassette domain-containing protein [Arthrobacter caoxuetaonis]MCC3296947.1 ATP-binding cassette domain-containing protein [Arthrobacter caoxuetaonis]MCC9193023.1 ATP-binding cassette domain-containing protein [Arthrobacter sp. zg-Y916]USQ56242.1 ATP-binding cassette domain-containing protein [Arthrobacter caoxuetaonis]